MMVMKKGMKWRCKVVYYWCKSLGGGGKGRRSCLWLVFKEVSLQPTKNNNEPPPQLVFTALYFLLSSCCGRIWRWAVSVCVVTSQIYWPLTSTNFAPHHNMIWSTDSWVGYYNITYNIITSYNNTFLFQLLLTSDTINRYYQYKIEHADQPTQDLRTFTKILFYFLIFRSYSDTKS